MPTKVRDRLEAALDAIAGSGAAASTVMAKVHTEAARAAADAADARTRLGLSLGALDGALVSIKDLLDEAGEITTAGSRINRDLPPAKSDAPVVRRLRAAGAVIVGRTTMSEFAYSGIGINPHTGTPGNAADPIDRSIDKRVERLRRKLEKHGLDTDLIETVRSDGYIYKGPGTRA